jgi:hypothetical protein
MAPQVTLAWPNTSSPPPSPAAGFSLPVAARRAAIHLIRSTEFREVSGVAHQGGEDERGTLPPARH